MDVCIAAEMRKMTGPAHDRPWVIEAVRRIEADGINPEHIAIVDRLTTDPRMGSVWRVLQRHPASLSPEARFNAMGRALHVTYRSVADKRMATKLAVVLETQRRLRKEAETLRHVADDVVASVHRAPRYIAERQDLSQCSADAEAMRRVAAWREALAAQMRGEDDPLTIMNFRGDPLARGVQITVASFLKEEFAAYLYGTAATLTAVALGLAKVPSARISRSAFSRKKAV
jgi:hypothetical protein